MTNQERKILESLLCTEPQEDTGPPDAGLWDGLFETCEEDPPESAGSPPPAPEAEKKQPESPGDYLERMNQLNQECNHLFRVNQALRERIELLEEDLRQKGHEAQQAQEGELARLRQQKERMRLVGFFTGVAAAWLTAFSFGYITMLAGRLFNLLASALETAPALLAGAVITSMLGLLLLVKGKSLADSLLTPLEDEEEV